MKTLKKSLCLILALVFVLGLCTFGAGAAFTDDADVNYDGAVTVMNGLGILKGYEDGSFQPAKTVTRAEAATMITKMILGEAAAAKLPAASAFADVPASNWAAPFINYCATKGIIKGYGDGNYGPNDPVTGLQLAKMLLVACGYGEMNEFAPDTWEIYTFTYAIEEGIYDGVETSDFAAPATREECALYVFNTLFVPQVKYDVDMNDYDAKTYKDGDDTYPVTFAYKVWKLASREGMVIANQATGADYTVIAPVVYDRNGEFDHFDEPGAINYDFESGEEVIGHKVIVYYNTAAKKDADRVKYYNAYLSSDISTVYSTSNANPFITKTLGDLSKEMGYPETEFEDVAFFANGVHKCSLLDKVDQSKFVPGAYNIGKDTQVKGATSGAFDRVRVTNGAMDSASGFVPAASLIVDERGEIISAVKNSYAYGKVTGLEDGYVYFTADKPLADDSVYGKALAENCYEDIAKGDFVVVDWYGDIYTLSATSTQTIKVSQLDVGIFGTTINGTLIADKQSAIVGSSDKDGTPAVIPVYGPPAQNAIAVNDIVKFYIGKDGKAFDAIKITDGANYSYVYVTAINSKKTSEWQNADTEYYAQAVDSEGTAVMLYIGHETKDGVLDYGVKNLTTGLLYRVEDGHDADAKKPFVKLVNDATTTEIQNFTGDYDGTETRVEARQYLTSATKYFYICGKADDLEIKELNGLVGNNITGYYVAKDPSTPGNVSTIWVTNYTSRPIADSYVYVSYGMFGGASSDGTKDVNGQTRFYYSVYVDGIRTANFLVSEVNSAQDVGFLPMGFYSYEVDNYGCYKLTKDTNGVTSRITDGDVYQGKLMAETDHDGWKVDDVDLSDYTIVDLTFGYQDTEGRSHTVTDADSLTEALEYCDVDLAFVYDSDPAVKAPVGAIYVTAYHPVA